MKNVVWWMAGCLLLANFCACSGKKADHPAQSGKAEQKVNPAGAAGNAELATRFLLGAQAGAKSRMYEAANLTTEIANDSRDKLIHSKQNKLTGAQRLGYEHALRISGDIDFFVAKMRRMFPPTASFKITGTEAGEGSADARHFVHAVTVTYGDKAQAVRDKTGRPIKELIVHLQQTDRTVDTRLVHEFTFDSKDFEKISNKEFEVISYF